MKKSGPKTFWIIPALLVLAGLAWCGYLAWRPDSPTIEPAQVTWPEAETVIDCRNLALRVPDPFKLSSFSAEVAGPGEDDDLHFHEYVYDSRDGADFGIKYDLNNLESRLRVSGHGWLSVHHLTLAGRPAVLAVEYGPLSHGDGNLLHPRLYVLWDQSYLMIEHSHFAWLDISETDSGQASLAERERFLERAGEFMTHLGRGDFQGRDGGLKALSRLSRRDGASWEAWLTLADFDWWGNNHWLFLWEKGSPPDVSDYFWQFSLNIGKWDQAPQWLGLWRLILETVRFPVAVEGTAAQ